MTEFICNADNPFYRRYLLTWNRISSSRDEKKFSLVTDPEAERAFVDFFLTEGFVDYLVAGWMVNQ
jgi:hypothetical protein